MKLGEFLSKDSIAMLFLLTLSALESKCKDTKIIPNGKKIFYGSPELLSFSPHGLPEKRRGIRGKDRGKKMVRRW